MATSICENDFRSKLSGLFSLNIPIGISCLVYAGNPQICLVCKHFAALVKSQEGRYLFLQWRLHSLRVLCAPYLQDNWIRTLFIKTKHNDDLCLRVLNKGIQILLKQTPIHAMSNSLDSDDVKAALSALNAWNLLIFLRGLIPYISSAALPFCTEVRKFDIYAKEPPAIRCRYMQQTGIKIAQWLQQRQAQLSTIRAAAFTHKMLFMPSELYHLSGLRELKISTQLQKLNSSIGFLLALQRVSLQGNALETLPPSFASLNITHLDLSENAFKNVPLSVCALKKLQVFIIRENQIKDFPQQSRRWQELRYIDFSYNRCEKMPRVLSYCKKLRFIYAQFNQIQAPPPLITSTSTAEIIDLTGNPVAGLPIGIPFRLIKQLIALPSIPE